MTHEPKNRGTTFWIYRKDDLIAFTWTGIKRRVPRALTNGIAHVFRNSIQCNRVLVYILNPSDFCLGYRRESVDDEKRDAKTVRSLVKLRAEI